MRINCHTEYKVSLIFGPFDLWTSILFCIVRVGSILFSSDISCLEFVRMVGITSILTFKDFSIFTFVLCLFFVIWYKKSMIDTIPGFLITTVFGFRDALSYRNPTQFEFHFFFVVSKMPMNVMNVIFDDINEYAALVAKRFFLCKVLFTYDNVTETHWQAEFLKTKEKRERAKKSTRKKSSVVRESILILFPKAILVENMHLRNSSNLARQIIAKP